jgi:hypothetical protein
MASEHQKGQPMSDPNSMPNHAAQLGSILWAEISRMVDDRVAQAMASLPMSGIRGGVQAHLFDGLSISVPIPELVNEIGDSCDDERDEVAQKPKRQRWINPRFLVPSVTVALRLKWAGFDVPERGVMVFTISNPLLEDLGWKIGETISASWLSIAGCILLTPSVLAGSHKIYSYNGGVGGAIDLSMPNIIGAPPPSWPDGNAFTHKLVDCVYRPRHDGLLVTPPTWLRDLFA